jgi:LPXTG-site transpeptidase (sortase) family protein
MRSKIPLLWSVLVLGAAGIICVAAVIFFLIPDLPSHDFYVAAISPARPQILQSEGQVNPGLPIRLIIPKIDVDTAIEHLGLTSAGIMAVPAGPTDAAWFDLGPRPGATGSAVIAGHEGWKDNISAVFDDLHKLQKGDKIYVADDAGATTTFVVSATETYDQNGDTSDIFNSSDGKAHLNLITCEGTWNAAEQSYSDRLVVFAEKE